MASTPRSHTLISRRIIVSGTAGLGIALLGTAGETQSQVHRTPGLSGTGLLKPARVPSVGHNTVARQKQARVAVARAQQLELQGVVVLAERQYKTAVQLLPSSLEMSRELARFYTRTNSWDQAVSSWRYVLALAPGRVDVEASAQMVHAQNYQLARRAVPVVARNDFAPGTEKVDSARVSNSDHQGPYTSTRSVAQTAPGPEGAMDSAPVMVAPAPEVAPLAPAQALETTAVEPAVNTVEPVTVTPLGAMPLGAMPLGAQPLVGATPQSSFPSTEAVAVAPIAPPSVPVAAAPVSPVAFKAPARKVLRVSKVNAAKAWPLVNRAGQALAAKKTTQALSLYRQAYKLDPNNQYAGPGVATSLIILGRFNEAASTYLQLLALKPDHTPYQRGLADAYFYGRKYREALGVNNRILTLNAGDFSANLSNAQIYTFVRNYTSADKHFERATKAKPRDVATWTAWGESLSYRQNPRALGALNRALALKPGHTPAQVALANYYNYIGDFGRSSPLFRTVLAKDASNVKALVGLGDALAFTNQPTAAVPLYERALRLQSNNVDARLGLGRALVYVGRPSEGTAELRRVLIARPGDLQALDALALGQSQISPQAAEQTYLSVIARQTNPVARANSLAALADVRARNNNYEGANQAYAQAVGLNPSDSAIALSFAQLLVVQEQYEQARPLVAGVAAAQPRNARALALQLIIENKIGDPATAQLLAQRLETAQPASAEEALQLADALRVTGNLEGSQKLLKLAVDSAVTSETQLRVANAVKDSGDYPTAIGLYQKILGANPGNTQARLSLAEVLIYEKDLGAANQQIQNVLLTDPNNVEAKVLQATVALRGDTPESRAEAERQASSILVQNPNNPDAQVILGEVMTSRKKFADAVAQFRSAVAAEPGNLQARVGLARNLYYSRDVDGAVAEYQQVIRLAPTDTTAKLELAQIFLDRNRFSDAETLYRDVLALRRSGALLSPPSARSGVFTRSLAKLNPLARLNAPVNGAKISASRRPALAERKKVLLAQVDLGNPLSAAPGTAGADMAPRAMVPLPVVPQNNAPVPIAPNANLLSPAAPLPMLAPQMGTGALSPGEQVEADQVVALRGLGEIRRRQNRFTEAFDFFNLALAVEPTDAASRVGLAQSLRGQSKYVEALQQVDRVLSTDASNLQGRVLRAQLLGDTGKPAQAQEELDDLVASLPEEAPVEVFLTLAQAFNSLSNYNASLQLLEAAQATFPGEPAVPRTRAETLTFARRYPEALALYDQLIAADPADADALLGKARVYNYGNNLTEASAQYLQVLAVQPNNYQATTELADIESRRANFAESIRLYQVAIEGNPNDLATQVELARVQRYAGQSGASEATLTAVLERDVNNTAAYTERGILRGQLGSFESAQADLNKALAIAPTDLQAQLGLAEVQGYAGQYEASINGYRAALVRDPQNLKARTELAMVLSYSGEPAAALKELDTVLSQSPNDPNALLGKADVLARSGRVAEAINSYNSILVADPGNRRATQGLADAYIFGGQFAASISTYDKLLVLDPTNTGYKIQRARALAYSGRHAAAMASLRQVVAAEPGNLQARLALAEAGTNSGQAGLRNTAIAEYRSILLTSPDNVPARVGLGRALSYRGDFKEAKINLNQALAVSPNNVEARYALAETQRFEGKNFDARDNYRQVLEAQPVNKKAQYGLGEVRRSTANTLTAGGSYYNDSNGVTVRSFNFGPTFRTRALTFGVIAERGKFKQGAVERDRDALTLLLAKQFGPLQARLLLSRLKYSGAPSKTLYDLALNHISSPRKRYYLGAAKRDIFESDAAVLGGITAQVYTAGFTQPLGKRLDLEGEATYYKYSDSNDRITLAPKLFYRFSPTNPTLRVGVGYTFDDTENFRSIYYTPQDFKATSLLADYVVDSGPTRYGIYGAKSLTDTTGSGGVNRPADTLFGFVNHDVNEALEVFANGGIVRTPTFRSNQVSGGVNLRF